jgi:hypothetical protein
MKSNTKTKRGNAMNLKKYFEDKDGIGVLSTADSSGLVDAAIYARPHVQDDGTVAFIMANRHSYSNLLTNPHAVYLFKENGPGYKGKRLFLTKLREEHDEKLIDSIRRKKYTKEKEEKAKPFSLVFFTVDHEGELVN